jgi:uncharacterized membrane protein (DUF4010 family)
VAALLVVGNVMKLQTDGAEPGLTTEMAVLLMFGVGAYLVNGSSAMAVVVGGSVALLLHYKAPLHTLVARIGEEDLHAIMRFVLIALVVLPVLPDQAYGPYRVLNPRNIWLMVVLIVGISLAGYVAYKLFGERGGAAAAGLLGGLISSTATTVSYARTAHRHPSSIPLAALVIVIASGIAYARVIVEIAVVAPAIFVSLAPPLGVMLVTMALVTVVLFRIVHQTSVKLPAHGNPAELRTALVFGGLYALVVFALAAAQDQLGDTALYGVALLSGLHDMDAITLSTAQSVDRGDLAASTGWRVILVASLANFVMKAILATLLGNLALLRWLAGPFGAALVAGGLLLMLWNF